MITKLLLTLIDIKISVLLSDDSIINILSNVILQLDNLNILIAFQETNCI